MAETVERLVATLEADIRGFTKNMQEAQRQFDRNAAAIERRQNALMNRINSGFGKVNFGPLISRYFSVAAAIRATQAVVRESIENNEAAAKAWERLDKAMSEIGDASGPAVTAVLNLASSIVEELALEIEGLTNDWNALKNSFSGGVTIPMGVSPLQPGYNKTATRDKAGNYTPQPGGFAVPGVTDVTPDTKEAERRAREKAEIEKGIAQDGFDIQQHFREKNAEADAAVAAMNAELQQHYSDVQQTIWQREADELADIHKRMQAAWDTYYEGVADKAQESADFQKTVDAQRLGYAADFFGALSQLSTNASEEQKAITKAAALAEAIILGYLAVQRALAEVPPPLNIPAAAAAGAAAAVQVANIAAREHGGPVRAGTPYIVGEKRPELFVPSQSGYIIPRIPSAMSPSGGGSIANTFHIDARGATPGVERLIETAVVRAVAISQKQTRKNFASMMHETQRDRL